jgi:hypothetical protein
VTQLQRPVDPNSSDLTVPGERWEHGSDLHLEVATGSASFPWSGHRHALFGSGRDALRALVEWGRTRGWRRILAPSYYCHEVTARVVDLVEVRTYAHAPTAPAPTPVDTEPGDVVLRVALFGGEPLPAVSGPGIVLEDHSHDLMSHWSITSRADFAFASLRKTLPLPDGGVLWSPRGLEIPDERPVTLEHDRAALERLLAMTLKRHYLEGAAVDKEEFRSLSIDGEAGISHGEVSGISSFSRFRLPTLPAAEWREIRSVNRARFRAALGDASGLTLLDTPFAATILFDEGGVRDRVRDALIAARIYPAVLWPLDQVSHVEISSHEADIGRRLLSIHCDYRYDEADMARVAAEIRGCLSSR